MAKKLMSDILKKFRMNTDNNKETEKDDLLESKNTEETQNTGNDEEKSSSGDNVTAELESQVAELKDKYLRLFAEFENYKKRTSREKLEMISTAAERTIVSFLPVLDDFERAKAVSESENSTEPFSEGVTLVFSKFVQALKNQGLKEIEIVDGIFDSNYQEAITEIPAPTPDMSGKVIDVVEKGYFLNDKVIRYAKVVVGK